MEHKVGPGYGVLESCRNLGLGEKETCEELQAGVMEDSRRP